MSFYVLIPIGVALVLFILFVLWYSGWGKPMSNVEANLLINNLKKTVGAENGPDNSLIKSFRELVKSDDGKSFIMINLIRFKDLDPKSEAMKANAIYNKQVLPKLIRNGSHPIFVSKVAGRFITPESIDEWDQVAMVRYRSRRDMIKMATQMAEQQQGKDKWVAIEKTHVFPAKSILRNGPLRIGVFMFLTIIVLFTAIFL